MEHYTNVREEAGRGEVEGPRRRLEPPGRIESTKAELGIEGANLTKVLRDHQHERDAILRETILALWALSESPCTRRPAASRSRRPAFDAAYDAEVHPATPRPTPGRHT